MNARAHELMVTLRVILGTLPGASSLVLQTGKAWAVVLITTSSDQAVSALREDLGLGEVEITSAKGQWWLRASAEYGQGSLRIVVTGPHHMGSPPPQSEGASSGSG
jgi:hypothetical protein